MSRVRYIAMLAGEPVERGQALIDFRGGAWAFVHVTGGPVSSGKIVVTSPGGQAQREFFPSVFPGLSVHSPQDDGDG